MSATTPDLPGGTWTLGDTTVTRFGYGAMQLAGPWVMGPPKDHDAALAVLREAVDLGITHIDTAEAYGPRVVNELIREALHPYPEDLLIATKVGGRRDAEGGWPTARQPDELRQQIADNLETLGVDVLDLVHLRLGNAQGPVPEPIGAAFETLVDLQQQGVIRHLGVSNATGEQVAQAQRIAPIVSVQNMYNLAVRHDDALIDRLAAEGVAYVPFFPLGGFSPVQSDTLTAVATRLGSTPISVALAWLLRRSPNILLIAGTSSVAHLRENIAGAGLELSAADLDELHKIAG
ncbi:oxidoreductase [Micromonospora endophytica]|uniref:Oxidoreductase n=1 Tax=Micromonospora endophytica TaxID=515350 RepID=A0A2W2CF66_9ACTN|nr:oxidoreductase [Micromonospora endophytica]PZF98011.1 oxidoreductase [Micromonospora endophytica]RIW49862.1 oxidoreductase [Micromonospora endophytica]BCJ57203.1 oxidoreductase [Micromonospora endophytica]